MKRKSEEPQPPARKITRKAVEPQKLGVNVRDEGPMPLPKQPCDVEVASVPANNIHATHDSARTNMRRYNTLLNFLPDSAAARLQSQTATIDKSGERLSNILRRAHREAKVEEKRISEQEEQMTAFVLTDKRWYERGDLLALDLERLKYMLSVTHTIDVESFSKVARSSVVAAFAEVRRQDHMNDSLLLDKSICLLEVLSKVHTPASTYHAFHFSILLVAEALRPHQASLWRNKSFDTLYYACDGYVYQCTSPGGPPRRPNFHAAEYFNFAEARRQLWVAWKDAKCFGKEESTYDPVMGVYEPECFHSKHNYLFEDVQESAHNEVRAGVMLAVGHRLPTELADEIFEFALAAEGLPLEWEVVVNNAIAVEYQCPWNYGM